MMAMIERYLKPAVLPSQSRHPGPKKPAAIRIVLFIIGFFAFSAISLNGWGQSTIWALDFESSGGYSTSVLEFTDNAEDYFTRTDGSNIGSEAFNSIQGSYYFAAQDLDGEGGPSSVTLTINDVNISGYTALSFYVYIAEDDASDAAEDWDAADYVHFQYDVDNSGSWSNLIWVEASGSTNTAPKLDLAFDGTGESTTITNTFAEFSKAISGTGSVIDIKVTMVFDAGDEDIAFDNLRLTGTPSTPTPTISVTPTSLSGFTYVQGSGPSGEQTFTVSGSNLTNDISIASSTDYEISKTSGSGYTSPLIFTQSGGTVNSTTVYVRLKAGLSAGNYNSENITASSTGATNKTVTCSGSVTLPAPTAWINEFHYDNDGTDVNEIIEVVIVNPGSYTLSQFRVDAYNGGDGTSYLNGTLDAFTVGATSGNATIYTKAFSGLQNGAPDGIALSYNGTLIQFLSYEGSFAGTAGIANGVTSTDIGVLETDDYTAYSLQLSGTGCSYSDFTWQSPYSNTMGSVNNGQTLCSSTPTITILPNTLTGFSYVQSSGPSSEQTFTIFGASLTANISIDAPADYEISTGTGGSFTATDPITLTQSGGNVASTIIYVRLKAGLNAGAYDSEIITASSTGATNKTVTCGGTVTTTAATPIATWDFDGLSNYGASPQSATTSNANVTVVGLTRGSGVGTTPTAAGDAWGGTDWDNSSSANAISANEFITFSITANTAYKVSFSSVNEYNVRRSSTGPAAGLWQYMVEGGSFVNIGSAITWGSNTTSSGNPQSAIDLSGISNLQNVAAGTTITFRIVNYGASGTGSWYLNDPTSSAGNDFIINGIVETTVIKPEPSGHAGSFTCGTTTSSSIPLSWTDATGTTLPDGYLILYNTTNSFTSPVDLNSQPDGPGVKNVVYGSQSCSITGLSTNTTYYFKIWPYTNSGTNINYKVDGTIPATSCATISAGAVYLIDEEFTSTTSTDNLTSTTCGFTTSTSGWISYSSSVYNRNANAIKFTANGTLTSPVFSAGADMVCFWAECVSGYNQTADITIEESDGTKAWTTVGTVTDITVYPQYYFFPLSSSTVQVRFVYDDGNNNSVYFDDVMIRSAGGCSGTISLVERILVNSCAGTDEGTNEIVMVDIGSNPINVSDLIITFPSVTAGGLSFGSGCSKSFFNNFIYPIYLNNLAGCTFVTQPGATIPANSKLLIFTGASPDYTYNFSGACGDGNSYYAIFCNNAETSGRFANAPDAGTSRYLSIIDKGTGCYDQVYYDDNIPVTEGEVASYQLSTSDRNPTYQNFGCENFIPLPVELLSFEATCEETQVTLSWYTASEINSDYFMIERSPDLKDWTVLGTQKAAGFSNDISYYEFVDKEPSSGIIYYRLKQTDYNGEYAYYGPVTTSCDENIIGSFDAFPNPANDLVNCSVYSSFETEAEVELYNLFGQLILKKNVNLDEGSTVFILDVSMLSGGVYYLTLHNSSGSYFERKQLIVE